MKSLFLSIIALISLGGQLPASGDPAIATYFVGVDKNPTPRNGTDGNPYPDNPNFNRLTFLYAHTYVGSTFPTKVINHYHPLGAYRYTGPSTAPGLTFSNAKTPEGNAAPLTLQAGSGPFSNMMVSNLGSPTSSAYSDLEIKSIEDLRSGTGPTGTAPTVPFTYSPSVPLDWETYLNTASGEWLLLNSSPLTPTFADGNGTYASSVSNISVGMELLSLTSGLGIYDSMGTQLFTAGVGTVLPLGVLSDSFSFEPIFGSTLAATTQNQIFEARFRLVDQTPGGGLGGGQFLGSSGEFRYQFQIAAVPEPGSFGAVVAMGLAVSFFRRRKSN